MEVMNTPYLVRIRDSTSGRTYNSLTQIKILYRARFFITFSINDLQQNLSCWSHSWRPVLLLWLIDPCRILRDCIWLCSFTGKPLFRNWLIIVGWVLSLRSCPCLGIPAAAPQEALGSPLNASRETRVTMVIILGRLSPMAIATFWPSRVKTTIPSCLKVLNYTLMRSAFSRGKIPLAHADSCLVSTKARCQW